jgi:AAA family ATP:ADP antiporter
MSLCLSQNPTDPRIVPSTGAKAAGSVVTNALSDSVTNLVHFGGLVSVGISIFLVWVAAWMGNKFEEYTETGFIVGQDPVTPSNGSEVVSAMDPTEPQTEMRVCDGHFLV